jgi:hypothetical protein
VRRRAGQLITLAWALSRETRDAISQAIIGVVARPPRLGDINPGTAKAVEEVVLDDRYLAWGCAVVAVMFRQRRIFVWNWRLRWKRYQYYAHIRGQYQCEWCGGSAEPSLLTCQLYQLRA